MCDETLADPDGEFEGSVDGSDGGPKVVGSLLKRGGSLKGNVEGCAKTLLGDPDGVLEGSAAGSEEGPEAVGPLLKLIGSLEGDEEGCAKVLG